MMGEDRPLRPLLELHVDLTPEGDTKGSLVNKDSDLCIEIWNLVFIQFNAEADGTFRELPAKHVDTGMGFERACSTHSKHQELHRLQPKAEQLRDRRLPADLPQTRELSGKTYVDIYSKPRKPGIDQAIAFRVIADHIRTLSFSIADGILPGNTGRNYALRRILRRAVKYGRTLGFDGAEPFLPKLVDTP